MENSNDVQHTTNIGNEDLADVSSSFYDYDGWMELGEDDGDGGYCCGKRSVEKGNVFICLKCGGWEYSSS